LYRPPTLTIIALALRLAEHIRHRMLPNASPVT
jgi:choline dehydrogenase-like flavoprotein